jgi:hypothetical protein
MTSRAWEGRPDQWPTNVTLIREESENHAFHFPSSESPAWTFAKYQQSL